MNKEMKTNPLNKLFIPERLGIILKKLWKTDVSTEKLEKKIGYIRPNELKIQKLCYEWCKTNAKRQSTDDFFFAVREIFKKEVRQMWAEKKYGHEETWKMTNHNRE